MEISAHKTDSMERIGDADDMNMAKALMGKRMKAMPAVAESVVVSGNPTKPADT
jgi:hypothetical protein